MKAADSVIAFGINIRFGLGIDFIYQMRLFSITVSLGDAEFLIQHPASMTHFTYTQEERADAGISIGLIRISVDLKNVDDLIDDLKQAIHHLAREDHHNVVNFS